MLLPYHLEPSLQTAEACAFRLLFLRYSPLKIGPFNTSHTDLLARMRNSKKSEEVAKGYVIINVTDALDSRISQNTGRPLPPVFPMRKSVKIFLSKLHMSICSEGCKKYI
jgi:hypothetical protein